MKKRRILRKIGAALAAALILILGALCFVLKAAVVFAGPPGDDPDYSAVIRDHVPPEARVVDVALLGAHDAFSHRIQSSSPHNPQSGNAAFNDRVMRPLASGLSWRTARAQYSGAAALLKHGVRYFDVRITNAGGEWFTVHNLLSDRLEFYLGELIDFLSANPGEFIVFDIQHANLGDKSFEELFEYIGSVKSGGKSLLDFTGFDPSLEALGTLRYGDVVRNGAGVICLAKTETRPGSKHYNYDDSIRSVWHNKVHSDAMLAGIDREYRTLLNDAALDRDKFRVNQAQKTPNFGNFSNILASVSYWSLLDGAAGFNAVLVSREDFSSWLGVMPIFMVDYADSTRADFNRRAIEKINSFNRSL